jgi:DNA invertase Pin-like site-specific DNA recombinase
MLPKARLEGVEIVREFQDEAISGGGMKKRDDFQAMLRYCQEQERAGQPVEALVCYDTARFSRADSNETAAYIWQFRQAGVNRLLTSERWYDFRREEDRAIFNLTQDFTNNRYLRDHAHRIMRGKKDNAEAAFWNGGMPYGFDRLLIDEKGQPREVCRRLQAIAKPKGWKVVPVPIKRDDPDPDKQLERQTVEFIFRTFTTQDVSRWAIADMLNERGVPGPGSRPGRLPTKWCSDSIGKVLTNPIYVGDFRWGAEAAGRYYRLEAGAVCPSPNGAKRTVNPAAAIFRQDAYRDYWPEPFIDRETWDAVQRKIAAQGKQARPRRDSYVLSGILHCGRCGSCMTGKTSTTVSRKGTYYTYRKYCCRRNRVYGNHACSSLSVREDLLLPFLVDRLRKVYLDPERLEGLRRQLKARAQARLQTDPARAARLKERLIEADAEIVRGRRNLFRAKDDDTFAELNEELLAALKRRGQLAKELDGLEKQKGATAEEVDAIVDRAIARLFDLSKGLDDAAPERLRAILKQLVVRVDLYFEEPGRPRQWFRFSKGVIKLRPFVQVVSSEGSVTSLPGAIMSS